MRKKEKFVSKTKFGYYEIAELEQGPLICFYKGKRMRRSLTDITIIKALCDELDNARAGINETPYDCNLDCNNKALSLLTNRELEVVLMIHEGMLNKQIAFYCDITSATVKAHITNIMKKLGVNSRTQILKKTIGIKDTVQTNTFNNQEKQCTTTGNEN